MTELRTATRPAEPAETNGRRIDGEIVEPTALSIRPARAVAEWEPQLAEEAVARAVAQVRMRERFMSEVMRRNFDYGVIPGTGTKPTLLKPGAERLLNAYGLHAALSDEAPPIINFESGVFLFRRQCRIYRQTGPMEGDRILVGQASGTCSSFESKYRWRQGERVCPKCGKSAIIKGKAEYGGGWLCFKKKDGCGATFPDTDPQITGQSTGRVENPDMADVLNTVEKMADKRALIAATIIATGWSDTVTQDLDDNNATAPPNVRVDTPRPVSRQAPDAHSAEVMAAQGVAWSEEGLPNPASVARVIFEHDDRGRILAGLRFNTRKHGKLGEEAIEGLLRGMDGSTYRAAVGELGLLPDADDEPPDDEYIPDVGIARVALGGEENGGDIDPEDIPF